MEVLHFRLSGRFGHFLRAEAGVSMLSYPFPPRTVLLGMLGAILGLPKDQPQQVLEPAHIAVSGRMPQTHWHKAKFRKDPPESLPWVVKNTQKQDKNTKPEQATLIAQEWLFQPCYEVWVSLPVTYHAELCRRVLARQWYYSPCMGLSEMAMDIQCLSAEEEAIPLTAGVYAVHSVSRQDAVQLDFRSVSQQPMAIQTLRMPRTVTDDRIFRHAKYVYEIAGEAISVQTSEAYKISDRNVVFL